MKLTNKDWRRATAISVAASNFLADMDNAIRIDASRRSKFIDYTLRDLITLSDALVPFNELDTYSRDEYAVKEIKQAIAAYDALPFRLQALLPKQFDKFAEDFRKL